VIRVHPHGGIGGNELTRVIEALGKQRLQGRIWQTLTEDIDFEWALALIHRCWGDALSRRSRHNALIHHHCGNPWCTTRGNLLRQRGLRQCQ
jgi:hypothetical protein